MTERENTRPRFAIADTCFRCGKPIADSRAYQAYKECLCMSLAGNSETARSPPSGDRRKPGLPDLYIFTRR